MDAGAAGYVLKHSAAAELVTAIHHALQGRTYVTPLLAAELLHAYRERQPGQKNSFDKLTPRQREVLQLVIKGRSAKEIASLLHMSARTAEFHKARLMDVSGTGNTAELIQYATRHGFIAD